MKVNNLYSKPVVKTLFFIVLALGLVNVLVLFTNMQPFTSLSHTSIAVVFFAIAGILMSRDFFVKYDSSDAVVEIERSGLFTSNIEVHSGQVGYVKYRIKQYSIEEKWYGARLVLTYETSTGYITRNAFPIFFFKQEQVIALRDDLEKITHTATRTPNAFHNNPLLS